MVLLALRRPATVDGREVGTYQFRQVKKTEVAEAKVRLTAGQHEFTLKWLNPPAKIPGNARSLSGLRLRLLGPTDTRTELQRRLAEQPGAYGLSDKHLEADNFRAQRAEREKAEAVQREQQAKADAERRAAEAVAAEQRRVAQQQAAEAAEAKRREADKAHKAAVNRAALAAFVAGGMTEECAKQAITLIAKKAIPAVSITY